MPDRHVPESGIFSISPWDSRSHQINLESRGRETPPGGSTATRRDAPRPDRGLGDGNLLASGGERDPP